MSKLLRSIALGCAWLQIGMAHNASNATQYTSVDVLAATLSALVAAQEV